VVVTVEAHKGGETPVVNREDVMVHEGHDRDAAIDWVPAQGEHALLELMIMLDDGSNTRWVHSSRTSGSSSTPSRTRRQLVWPI